MDKESIYIQKLSQYVNTEGRERLSKIKREQETFFVDAINDIHNSNNDIKLKFYKCCNEISKITNLKVQGNDDTNNKSSIIISNHIGLAKLIKFKLIDLPLKSHSSVNMKDLENNESYILRIAHIIAHILKKNIPVNIHPITIRYSYPFSIICSESSFLLLDEGNNFNKIKNYIQATIKNCKIPQHFIIFPEARTSGKYNNKGIFDLDTFHTGFYELAKQTQLPIFSYIQYFDSNVNFYIDIIKHNKQNGIDSIRHDMQTRLLNKTVTK